MFVFLVGTSTFYRTICMSLHNSKRFYLWINKFAESDKIEITVSGLMSLIKNSANLMRKAATAALGLSLMPSIKLTISLDCCTIYLIKRSQQEFALNFFPSETLERAKRCNFSNNCL